MGSTESRAPAVSDSMEKASSFVFSFDANFKKNDKWSCRDPNLVNQILLYSLGSLVCYKNMKCAFSGIFHGDLNIVQ